MNYIYCCNYFSFNLFDIFNPVYCTCLMYQSRYLQNQVRCASLSQKDICSRHANNSWGIDVSEEEYKVW